jgi:hypothetical protein
MAGGSDIFLSYEKSDLARAKRLVDAFESEGWSVWWDHKIPPGKRWAEVIENAIRNSRCVVVLWSTASINSKWVQKEARLADRLERLVPALIDAVEPPFEFEHIQAADLTKWEGTATTGFANLVAELHSRLQTVSASAKAAGTETKTAAVKRATPRRPADEVIPKRPSVAPFPRTYTRARVPNLQAGATLPASLRTPITDRQIGSKVAPSFGASTGGRLLFYLLAIASVSIAGMMGGYYLVLLLAYVHVPVIPVLVRSWLRAAPWLPIVIALVIEVSVIWRTWVIADDEIPTETMDYVVISAKAIGWAVAFGACFTFVVGPASQSDWVRNFVLIAVSTAGVTAGVFAILDEL